jgi:metal-responsive CopG/Arc/MetJ family transcriptional regulator
MNMNRTQIYIPKCDMDKLKNIAEKEQVSVSEIIRQFIKKRIAKESEAKSGIEDRP